MNYQPIESNKWIPFDEYNRKDDFIPIADVVIDTEITNSGKKKRNTLIQFVPTIPTKLFKEKKEWIYLFVVNGMIVKIGGTRTGLKERTVSYLCGHHVKERGKSGKCSITNALIYNTFIHYLKLDYEIKMYGYELPKTETTIEIFGEERKITAQTYHAYETFFLEDYKKIYNKYPILNDKCDPNYKG